MVVGCGNQINSIKIIINIFIMMEKGYIVKFIMMKAKNKINIKWNKLG